MILLQANKDFFDVKINDVIFTITPLTKKAVIEIDNSTTIVEGNLQENYSKTIDLYLKHSLKDVKGLKDSKGKEFKFEKDENGFVCQEHRDALFSNIFAERIFISISSMMRGNTEEVKASNGQPIDDIKITRSGYEPKK